MGVCMGGGNLELLTENKERNQEKMQPLRINLTTMLRKIPNLTPRNARKTWFLSFQSSQKCLTKAEIKNILDKRIQAPLRKGPHTEMCVIPTRNWFIYQKIVRVNAGVHRPQIKDSKGCVCQTGRVVKWGKFRFFSSACYFLLPCLHATQDFRRRSSNKNSGPVFENDFCERKHSKKHVRG